MSLDDWEHTFHGCPYGNDTPFEGRRSGAPEQGVASLPLGMNSNCYATAQLNERELCTVQYFYKCSDLKCSSKTYNNNYSRDFLRLCQNVEIGRAHV